jgi:hypothetical protein
MRFQLAPVWSTNSPKGFAVNYLQTAPALVTLKQYKTRARVRTRTQRCQEGWAAAVCYTVLHEDVDHHDSLGRRTRT